MRLNGSPRAEPGGRGTPAAYKSLSSTSAKWHLLGNLDFNISHSNTTTPSLWLTSSHSC